MPERITPRPRFVLEKPAVDALITAVILWVLVLLGEPIAIMAAGIASIAWKAYRHRPEAGSDA